MLSITYLSLYGVIESRYIAENVEECEAMDPFPQQQTRCVCVCLLTLCCAARQSRNLTGSGSSALNNTWPPGGSW